MDIAYAPRPFAAVTGLNLLEGNMLLTLAPARRSRVLRRPRAASLPAARRCPGLDRMGTPGPLLEGNFYWWGGLFHGVHKGSLST